MLGLSYGEIFLIIGATAALIGPKDLPIIAKTAGRLAGRAIGYVQLARGQFENVMQHTQFRQVRDAIQHRWKMRKGTKIYIKGVTLLLLIGFGLKPHLVNKELQDTMAQLEAIRHEIRSISIMNPGPLTRRLMDNPDQSNPDNGASGDTVSLNLVEEMKQPATNVQQSDTSFKLMANVEQAEQSLRAATSVLEGHGARTTSSSDMHSQATTYARLTESESLKGRLDAGIVDDRSGLLSVLPVSAQSAGLLPARQGEATGSDIVLEAVLEAEVARNAKDFFSQPQNQIQVE